MGRQDPYRRASEPQEARVNESYVRTVQLLLDVAPAVFVNPVFAMKGGTALSKRPANPS